MRASRPASVPRVARPARTCVGVAVMALAFLGTSRGLGAPPPPAAKAPRPPPRPTYVVAALQDDPLGGVLTRARAGDDEGVLAALWGLRVTAPPALQPRVRFLLGKRLAQRGSREALDVLPPLSPTRPAGAQPTTAPRGARGDALALTRARLALWRARAAALAGQQAQAREAAEVFLAAVRRGPSAAATCTEEVAEARLLQAEALARLGRGPEALAALRRVDRPGVPRHLRARALGDEARWAAAQAPERARRAAVALLTRYPDQPAPPDLAPSPDALPAALRYRRALHSRDAREYADARAAFQALARDGYRPSAARWEVADIGLTRLRDRPEDTLTLLHLDATRPARRRHEEALYRTIRALIKLDRYDEAERWMKRYDEEHAGPPLGGRYRERVDYYRAWLPFDRGDCRTAVRAIRDYTRRHTEHRQRLRALAAWCTIREGSWRRAVRAFGALTRRPGPLRRGRALYWQAHALDQLGRRDEARAKLDRLLTAYPLSWYSVLALRRLAAWEGRDVHASALPWPAGGGGTQGLMPGPEAWTWPRLGAQAARRLAQVRALLGVDEVDAARRLYATIRGTVEGAVDPRERDRFVLCLGDAVEDYRHGWARATGGSFLTMPEVPQPSSPRSALAYPLAYRPLVERLSAVDALAPSFAYAIMRQESAYLPTAVSHAEAVGALQMIQPTARRVAAELGVDYDPVTFPEPRVGFPFSFRYLRDHNRGWAGQLVLTAASYNAGPAPVGRWLKAHAGAPLDVLVEEFAYSEARSYARRVAEHTLRYLYLYEQDPARRAPVLEALFPARVDYDAVRPAPY